MLMHIGNGIIGDLRVKYETINGCRKDVDD